MQAWMHSLSTALLIASPTCLLAQEVRVSELGMPEPAGVIVELEGPPKDSSQGELVRQRFPNGAVHVERWVIETADGDFVNHGDYRQHDQSGQVVLAGKYRDGQRQGEWSQLISVGEVEQLVGKVGASFKPPFLSKADFVRGKLSGDWTCTDSIGNLVFRWSFNDGVREGRSIWYNGSGEVIREITYRNNLADGPAKVIVSENGRPQDMQFENGRMRHHVEQWYPAERGKKRMLKSQDWYLVPTPLNLASHDWAGSRVEHRKVGEDDKIKHGQTVSYFPNGNRQAQGQFAYGKRTGTFAWWYANGQEKTVGAYEEDLEQGPWTWWHENGMKQAKGSFDAGARVATWSIWDPAGKLVQRANTDTRRLAVRNPAVDEK